MHSISGFYATHGKLCAKCLTSGHSIFSPGEGGDNPGSSGPLSSSGGGGGGVLIDGQGPWVDRPASYGEGYGGGASQLGGGLPGAVVLDFAPDE